MKNSYTLKPLVAIWMVTYNHESFIAQAIESVMMQKTDFNYKLFIGEDYSTDRTREICVALNQKYPNKIEMILQGENTGGFKNAQDLYKLCYESGAKYIALCEGDDYWTDPLKLQKQVSFLDLNPGYSVCAHKTEVLSGSCLEKKEWRWDSKRTTFTSVDYLYALLFHTSSMMFRSDESKTFTPHKGILQGDIYLCLSVINESKYFIIEEYMSVYRQHGGGITNSLLHKSRDAKYKSWIVLLEKFNTQTNNKHLFAVWIKRKILFFSNKKSNQVSTGKLRAQFCYFFYKSMFQFYCRMKAIGMQTRPILIE